MRRFFRELSLPESQEGTNGDNQIVRPSDDEVKHWVRQNAEGWLVALQQNEDALEENPFDNRQSRMICYVLEYGGKRLGGIFLTLNPQRRTILFGHPFVNRDLLHNRYLLRFLGALMKKCFYTPHYDSMELFVPPRLVSAFQPLLDEVRASQSDELFAHYNSGLYHPSLVTGFSFKISDLPGLKPLTG
ncbi:hypothetical protein AAVH_43111 [Aphelenchoides avenae]|nr:hypothetical protein AAVH_43111 [Aphelenchus avenae]